MPIEVYGPETHMTAIVSMALGLATGDPEAAFRDDNMGRSLVDVDDDPMAKQTSAERKVGLGESWDSICVCEIHMMGRMDISSYWFSFHLEVFDQDMPTRVVVSQLH